MTAIEPRERLASKVANLLPELVASLDELTDGHGSDEQVRRARELGAKVDTALQRSLSANTLRAYRSDWAAFAAWCSDLGTVALPASPVVVAAYLADSADPDDDSEPMAWATLQRRKSTISQAHEAANRDNPDAGITNPTRHDLVRRTMTGIKRSIGVAPTRKRAFTTADIKAIIDQLAESDRLGDLRDRALILTGFHTAMRRSELVGLNVDDLEEHTEGLLIHIRRSKTDQEAAGRQIEVAYAKNLTYCAIRTLRLWLDTAGIQSGPIFRPVTKGGTLGTSRLKPDAVAQVYKRHAEQLGISTVDIAGHSTRRGFTTEALRGGADDRTARRTTGHTSTAGLEQYIDDAERFARPAPNSYLDL